MNPVTKPKLFRMSSIILNKPSKASQFNPDRRYKVGIIPTKLDFKKVNRPVRVKVWAPLVAVAAVVDAAAAAAVAAAAAALSPVFSSPAPLVPAASVPSSS